MSATSWAPKLVLMRRTPSSKYLVFEAINLIDVLLNLHTSLVLIKPKDLTNWKAY
uniref:Uncharacterized protein n=1 Tax=Rhizophora mucronata TaxID=61149 RepID=A0A2P2P788_RHIMU